MTVQRGLSYLSAESSPLELPAVQGGKDFPHDCAKSSCPALLGAGFPSSHALLQSAGKEAQGDAFRRCRRGQNPHCSLLIRGVVEHKLG